MSRRLFPSLALRALALVLLAALCAAPLHGQTPTLPPRVYLPYLTTAPLPQPGWVGQLGGQLQALALHGDRGYVAEGAALTVLDLSNPLQPRRLGSTLLPDLIQDIAVHGDTVYVAASWAGLRAVDVVDPTAPRDLGDIDPLVYGESRRETRKVVVADGYLYTNHAGLRIFSLADPHAPRRVNGDTDCDCRSFVVRGDRLYGSGLHILDISDRARPRPLHNVLTLASGPFPTIAVQGDYAYIAGSDGVTVVDVADPTAPRVVGAYHRPQSADYFWSFALRDRYLYLTRSRAGVVVLDLAEPTAPREVTTLATGGFAVDVRLAGSYGYVVERDRGVRVLDLTAPAEPRVVGMYNTVGVANHVTTRGTLAYVAALEAGLRIVDVSDPDEPRLVGVLDTPGLAWRVAVGGDIAYVADYEGGLRLVDVADPTRPRELGVWDTPGEAVEVAIADGLAYVADRSQGLRIIDTRDPTAPQEIGAFSLPAYAVSVAVANGYVYVGDEYRPSQGWYLPGGFLHVLDVADPRQPRQVGVWHSGLPGVFGSIHNLTVTDHDAYIPQGSQGVFVVDAADPTAPTTRRRIEAAQSANVVQVVGSRLYIGTNGHLQVLDVSDPTDTRELGRYRLVEGIWGEVRGLDVAEGYAYVAAGVTGLHVVRVP